MKNKAYMQVSDILPLSLTLVVAGIGIAFGLSVLADTQSDFTELERKPLDSVVQTLLSTMQQRIPSQVSASFPVKWGSSLQSKTGTPCPA